jgi:hypothetical protein
VAVVVAIARTALTLAPNLTYFERESANFLQGRRWGWGFELSGLPEGRLRHPERETNQARKDCEFIWDFEGESRYFSPVARRLATGEPSFAELIATCRHLDRTDRQLTN